MLIAELRPLLSPQLPGKKTGDRRMTKNRNREHLKEKSLFLRCRLWSEIPAMVVATGVFLHFSGVPCILSAFLWFKGRLLSLNHSCGFCKVFCVSDRGRLMDPSYLTIWVLLPNFCVKYGCFLVISAKFIVCWFITCASSSSVAGEISFGFFSLSKILDKAAGFDNLTIFHPKL